MLEIAWTSQSKRALKLVKQLDLRIKAIQQQVPYLAATYVKDIVESKIPSSEFSREYRRALRVSRIRVGSNSLESSYAVWAKAKESTKVISPDTMLLYFIPRRKGRGRSGSVSDVLIRYSPWTVDTLPALPPTRRVKIVVRLGRKGEVARIRSQRNQDSSEWRATLAKNGVRVRKPSLGVLSKRLRMEPDLYFLAMRTEFGIGPGKGKSHWRPALQALKRQGIKRMTKPGSRDKLSRALSSPNFQQWKRWPFRGKGAISVKGMKSFVQFQKKLGISPRGS